MASVFMPRIKFFRTTGMTRVKVAATRHNPGIRSTKLLTVPEFEGLLITRTEEGSRMKGSEMRGGRAAHSSTAVRYQKTNFKPN
jgi:hypothetical protein